MSAQRETWTFILIKVMASGAEFEPSGSMLSSCASVQVKVHDQLKIADYPAAYPCSITVHKS
jgi:hypothetical protein